ncbi:MAG: DUF1385 domain-containing protein [Chloroflexota bacterium]
MAYQTQETSPRQNLSYGGQALIEGVMMRNRRKVAVAVRNPQGKIVVYEQNLNPIIYQGPFSNLPFVRGLTMLWDALGIGLRALVWSAEVAAGQDTPAFDRPVDPATAAFSLSMSAGMVFLSPAIASSGLARLLKLENKALATMLEGVLRLGLVTGYIWLVGQTKEGQRLFAYHGAEHKTVNAVEAGAPLTPESVKQFPLEHPRCGTAFLLTVVLISTFIQVIIGRPKFPALLLQRLVLIPVVAGIAYEFIRFASAHMDNPTIRAIIAPNLLMQRLTTREPDLAMISVAIAAMERVLAAEDRTDSASNIELPSLHVNRTNGNGTAKPSNIASDFTSR